MKILWIKSDFLYPADTGGKIRSYNIMRRLTDNHEVSYLCLADEQPSEDALNHLKGFCKRVDYVPYRQKKKFSPEFYLALLCNIFSPRPYVINKYRNRRVIDEIKKRLAADEVDILLCDFLEMSANLLDITEVPKILFQHNVETEIWHRHFMISKRPIRKSYLCMEYLKYYNYEKMACAYFDDVLVVSESDGRLLRQKYNVKRATVIPTGVDTEYFTPNPDLMRPRTIVFVGSMDWLPNQDAVEYFVSDIYPGIKRRIPGVRFYVVGRRPPKKIINLSREDRSILVTGEVNDIRPYVDMARVCVVPIRIGGGTRIKIYEAMAQKKAIISTSIGAEGLPLVDGKHIIIADDPKRFAESVIRIMDDDRLMNEIGENAYALVTEKYGWGTAAGSFLSALEKVVNHRRGKVAVGGSSGES